MVLGHADSVSNDTIDYLKQKILKFYNGLDQLQKRSDYEITKNY